MASTNYPGSLDAYPVPNNGDTISVTDHWLGPAVIGIETELGTDPAGYATDVKTRLNDINPSSGLLAANGLQFPGTQSPSADANTLDDYEEGTWTPTIASASSYSIQNGLYTKIGNIISIQGHLFFVQSGTSFGNIGGLPFSASALIDYTSVLWGEYYSAGWVYKGVLRNSSTIISGVGRYDNTSGASNGQTYAFSFHLTYRQL